MSTDAIHYETLSGFTPLSTLGPYRRRLLEAAGGRPVELAGDLLCRSTTMPDMSVPILLFNPADGGHGHPRCRARRPSICDEVSVRKTAFFEHGVRHRTVVEVLSPNFAAIAWTSDLSIGVAGMDRRSAERQFDFWSTARQIRGPPQQDNRYASPVCRSWRLIVAFWQWSTSNWAM